MSHTEHSRWAWPHKCHRKKLCHMPRHSSPLTPRQGETYLDWQAATILKTLPTVRRETQNEEKWEKWVWNFHCPTPSLRTDAQLSQCSWPTDKWEKIVQFELVVSSRSAAFQINERLPQVWQEIFLKHSWETGPYHCNPLAMPSIRQARHYSRGDLAVPLLPGFLFLHSPPHSPLSSLGLHFFFFFFFSNPHLKRQCGGFYIINFHFPLLFVYRQRQPSREREKRVREQRQRSSGPHPGWRVEAEPTPLKVSMRGWAESNTYYGCLDSDPPLVDAV